MKKEVLKFTEKEAREIIYEDHKDFEIIKDQIINHSRWAVQHEVVVKRLSDNKFFISYYEVGATEQQDQQPYEYDDPCFIEVFPVEKTIIIYE